MHLAGHPQYQAYLNNRAIYIGCQQAMASWRASQRPISLCWINIYWTPERAEKFLRSLSCLLLEYNRVLWEDFPYCPSCWGGCCNTEGAFIQPIDLLALAILEIPFPERPEHLPVVSTSCIYRSGDGCIWPPAWRTLKCWLFYCLGPPSQESQLSDRSGLLRDGYERIARKLLPLLDTGLPDEIRLYEQVTGKQMTSYIADSLSFAEELSRELYELFVLPFNRSFQVFDQTQPGFFREELSKGFLCKDEAWISFLETLEISSDALPDGDMHERLLSDLETLEWIIIGHPDNSQKLLEELLLRYREEQVMQTGFCSPLYEKLCDSIRSLIVGH